MAIQPEFKLPADTPLVTRSPGVPEGRALVMEGHMFEDGKRRLILPQATPDNVVAEATQTLEEQEAHLERIRRLIRVVAVMTTSNQQQNRSQ